VIIQMRRPNEAEVWRALHAACSFHPGVGKIVVAVDEDIDPSNEAAVFWAMCYRMKPHKDVHIVGGMEKGHAPPFLYHHEEKGTDVVFYHLPSDESAMLCNAILKEPFHRYLCRSENTWRTRRKFGKSCRGESFL